MPEPDAREVALGRLAALGLDAATVDALLAQEPPGRDDWVAFLILASHARIARLVVEEGLGPA